MCKPPHPVCIHSLSLSDAVCRAFVRSAVVTLITEEATVVYSRQADAKDATTQAKVEDVLNAIESVGYGAKLAKEEPEAAPQVWESVVKILVQRTCYRVVCAWIGTKEGPYHGTNFGRGHDVLLMREHDRDSLTFPVRCWIHSPPHANATSVLSVLIHFACFLPVLGMSIRVPSVCV